MKRVVLMLALLLGLQYVSAQRLTSEGKDFWFAFTDNYDNYPSNLGYVPTSYEIIISSKVATSGKVEVGGVLKENFTLNPNEVRTITLSHADGSVTEFNEAVNRGIHVTSDDNVSVYAMMYANTRMEASIVLPNHMLGNEYTVVTGVSYNDTIANFKLFESVSMIVAVEDMSVEVDPAVPIANPIGLPISTPFTINLTAGQIYQIKSANPNEDLSGTMIKSTGGENFAVYAGNVWSPVECLAYMDPLYEVLLPESLLGNRYIYIPSASLGKDRIRVISMEDNNVITINDVEVATLQEGESYEVLQEEAAMVEGTGKINVAVFMLSGACSGYASTDPSMLYLNPVDQMYMDTISFSSPHVDVVNSTYMEVITRTKDVDDIYLDGTKISGFTQLPSDPEFSILNYEITNDAHTLTTGGCGFLAYIKGYGNAESYAYSAGVTFLDTTSAEVAMMNEIKSSSTVFCTSDTIRLSLDNSSHTPTGFEWIVDGNAAGTSDKPYYIFDTPGEHTVEVVLQYQCHPNDTLSKTISINDYQYVATSDAVKCEEHEVTLTQTSLNANFEWLHNGHTGNEITTGESGEYVVRVYDECFDINDTIQVEIYPDPELDLPEDTAACIGSNILLDVERDGATYEWNGNASDNGATFDVTTPGEYSVRVVKNGCTYFDTTTVSFNSNPTTDLKPEDEACKGDTIRIKLAFDMAIEEVKWSTGSEDRSVEFMESGMYKVEFSTADGCEGEDSIQLTFHDNPEITSLTNDNDACEGEEVNMNVETDMAITDYKWGHGVVGKEIAIDKSGTYTVKVITDKGCEDEESVEVIIYDLPEFDLGPDKTICDEENHELTAQNATKTITDYDWSTGSDEDRITVDKAGTYSLTVQDEDGCEYTSNMTLTVTPLPVFSLGADEAICEGETYQLSPDNSTPDYEWEDESTDFDRDLTESGLYWAIASLDGCTYRDSFELTVKPLPIVDLGEDTLICDTAVVLLDASNVGGSYLWNDGSTSSTLTADSGEYSVTVTVNGCVSEDEIRLDVFPCVTEVEIPDVFTPNGDDYNQEYTAIRLIATGSAQMKVYNRWGQLLFDKPINDPEEGWDGTHRGKNCSPGTYFVVFDWTDFEGKAHQIRKDIMLIR